MRRTLTIVAAASIGLTAFAPTAARAQGALPEAYRLAETWAERPQPRPGPEFTAPTGVDTADDGTLFVADAGSDDIHVLSASGQGLRVLGRAGSGPGQLLDPRDLDWEAGKLYVTDTGNARVQVLDADSGVPVAQWTGLGRPWSVALAADRAYVSDAESPAVFVTDRGGSPVAVWGPGQAVNLPFVTPRGLSVAPDGTLFVADPGAGSIFAISPTGELLKTLIRSEAQPAFRDPWDVAAADGIVFGIARRQVFAWQNPTGLLAAHRPGQYHFGAQGLAIGPGSGLVVSEQNERYAFAGISLYADRERINSLPVQVIGTVPAAIGSLRGPRRLALTPEGGAWLLDSWPRVQRWAAGGLPQGHFRAEGLNDIARAPGGDAYLVAGDLIRRVAADGTERWRWLVDGDGAAVVAASADGGDLFALDAGRGRLLHVTADGQASSLPLDGNPVDLAVAGGVVAVLDRAGNEVRLLGPTGIELRRWPAPWEASRIAGGQDGGAWFLIDGVGMVWKYAADGRVQAVFPGAPGGHAVDLEADRQGRVYVTDGAGNRVLVHAPDPAGDPGTAPSPGARCDLRPDKSAAPATVRVGQAVTVTLGLSGGCASDAVQLDLILALDRSGSMEGPKLAGAKAAAIGFAAELDFAAARVGVVAFNQGSDLVQPLTDDRAAVVRSVADLRTAGLTNLAAPVTEALAELTSPRGRPGVQKVVVLMTDGRPEGSTSESARAAAQTARDAGVQLYVIGLGGDVDGSLLRDMAGGAERYFQSPTEAGLAEIYTLIARRLATTTLVRQITVSDVVPANMRYVPDSAVPPASWDGSTLRWTLTDVPADGFQLHYRLLPRDAGRWPTNVRADGDYVDGLGARGRVLFPVPFVDVTGNAFLYLPLLYKSRCPQQRSDIVLVIDASSSMLEPVPGGSGTKLEAARAAATAFVGNLGLPQDQAAVLPFNSTARMAQTLTGDEPALARAIAGIEPGTGTRIDLGLAAARAELASARRRPGNLPVVVLLTDGQSDGGTAGAARNEARALREAGVSVFTIGLGANADGALLGELAGDITRYHYAPGADALRAIYHSLAWSLPCE
jgi:Mg-chelatase subunit ChlD/DNA-binding beta-propeller fold protein YncE